METYDVAQNVHIACPKTWKVSSHLCKIKASSKWYEVWLYSNLQYDKIHDVMYPDTEILWWSILCLTIIKP